MSYIEGPGEAVDSYSGGASIVAAADNGYASSIPATAHYVQVTAYTTDANDWVTLPVGVLPGYEVRGWSVPAHEMRTASGSNIKINDQDGDGTKEAAIPATTMWHATYINSTVGWVLRAWTKLAAPITAIIPD